MKDKILKIITDTPGLTCSQICRKLRRYRRTGIEDALWDLWVDGKIQLDPHSRYYLTAEGEKVFRHII